MVWYSVVMSMVTSLQKLSERKIQLIYQTIWDYYVKHRREFPWRISSTTTQGNESVAYSILVSEIMLQQTQAPRVVAKYLSFLKRFPDFQALSQASFQDVLSEWQGLGYNRRAKYLREIAQRVVIGLENAQSKTYGKTPKPRGRTAFPTTKEALIDLPGIGPNTAGSILAFAFNKPVAFIETNIRSVFIHFFFNKTERKITDKEILELVELSLDPAIHPRGYAEPREWFYALMDYGNMLKRRLPQSTDKKSADPARKSTLYKKQSSFKVSNREVRSAIIKLFLTHGASKDKKTTTLRMTDIVKALVANKDTENKTFRTKENIIRNVHALEKEQFIERVGSQTNRAAEHGTAKEQVYRIRK